MIEAFIYPESEKASTIAECFRNLSAGVVANTMGRGDHLRLCSRERFVRGSHYCDVGIRCAVFTAFTGNSRRMNSPRSLEVSSRPGI